MEYRTPIKGLVCNVGPTANTWSDAARQASIEARRAGGKAKEASAHADMKQTPSAHNDAMHSHIRAQGAMIDAANHHTGSEKAAYEKEAAYHGKQVDYHQEKSGSIPKYGQKYTRAQAGRTGPEVKRDVEKAKKIRGY